MCDKKTKRLPYVKSPCKNCPFRKDVSKGWLGQGRMEEIVRADSFVCHHNDNLQCAGQMLINGEDNGFVRIAKRMGIALDLQGRELVFDTTEECEEHHYNAVYDSEENE